MFSMICSQIHGWVNYGEAGDLECYHTHYDVNVMNLKLQTEQHAYFVT